MSTLSLGAALIELETVTRTIKELDSKAYRARVQRDAAVMRALENGATYRQVQKSTGLSRQSIIKIQNAPRQPDIIKGDPAWP